MSLKWILAGVAALLAGLLAGAISLIWDYAAAEGWVPQDELVVEVPAPPVTEINLQGVLSCQNVISLPAPIEGVLESVQADVGDEVFSNMLLATIQNTLVASRLKLIEDELDDAESEISELESKVVSARLESSRATADLSRTQDRYDDARKAAERQRILLREGATPKLVAQRVEEEFQEVLKEYQTARALAESTSDRVQRLLDELEAARRIRDEIMVEADEISADLEATEIFSPVDGILVGMAARQGDEVSLAMEDLFQIAVDLTLLEITVEPRPEQLARILPGQSAVVRVAELPNQPLEGVVSMITETAVTVEFRNPSPRVRPGLTGHVTIPVLDAAGHSEAPAGQ